jgi:uncharacterized membrane protein
MNFPDDENSLNNADTQPSEQSEMQPDTAPSEPPAADLGLAGDQVVPPFPPADDVAPEFDFPRMEEDVAAFHRELNGLQFSPAVRPIEDAPAPETKHASEPLRRRRRTQRLIERPDASEIAERLESIAYRAAPTFDFFVFSFLSGCILALGYILDAPAVLLIGILVAPILAPWVGASLASATGEVRFFGQTFGGFLLALTTVFVVGLLAGLASRLFQPLTSAQAFIHSRLWWPDLFLLVIGTMILIISFIQSENKPTIASLMLAYELYLPASAAGFGLGSGVDGLWPESGLVFLIHLALSLVVSLIVFFYMGFRPLESRGYFLAIGAVLASLVIVTGFAGLGSLLNIRGDKIEVTTTPAPTLAVIPATIKPLPVLPVVTMTPTTVNLPTATTAPARPTITPTIIATATVGFTPSPTLLSTPVYGKVQSKGDGASLRKSPGGPLIIAVQNGYLVEILNDAPVTVAGSTWVHVIVKLPSGDKDGWMQFNLINTTPPSGSP